MSKGGEDMKKKLTVKDLEPSTVKMKPHEIHYDGPILINLMKCGKCKRWFHGGMTGWICPYCNPQTSVTKVNKNDS